MVSVQKNGLALEDLPTEVLLLVLKFVLLPDREWRDVFALGALPAFRNLRWDHSLWQNISISENVTAWCLDELVRSQAADIGIQQIQFRSLQKPSGKALPHAALARLARRCRALTKLQFEPSEFCVTDSFLSAIASSGCKLTDMSDFVRINVSDHGLAALFVSHAPSNLRRIVIEQPYGYVGDETARAISISACAATLEILSLKNCQYVTDAGIECIMKSCPRIRELHVGGNRLTNRSIEAIFSHIGNTIVLLDWDGFSLRQQICCTDEVIQKLATCPCLRHLIVGDVNFFASGVSFQLFSSRGISLQVGQWVLLHDGGQMLPQHWAHSR